MVVMSADQIKRSQVELVRAARSLLGRYNLHNMPEDESRQWQCLADACLRSGVSGEDSDQNETIIKQQDIQQALQSAFASGFADFIDTILVAHPQAKLSDVRDALLMYARRQQH